MKFIRYLPAEMPGRHRFTEGKGKDKIFSLPLVFLLRNEHNSKELNDDGCTNILNSDKKSLTMIFFWKFSEIM